jgi:ketosteroid isomerase-like protein
VSCPGDLADLPLVVDERQAFLDEVLPAYRAAEVGFRNGDLTLRDAVWSHGRTVTLLGAAVERQRGWDDVRPVFEDLASSMAVCEDFELELLAADASGDLGFMTGIERATVTRTDGTRRRNELRVTLAWRRGADGWRIVHRHGDKLSSVELGSVGARP